MVYIIRAGIVSNFCSSEHFTMIAKAYVQLLPEDLWLRNFFSTVSDLCMISTRTFIFENVLKKSMLKVMYGTFRRSAIQFLHSPESVDIKLIIKMHSCNHVMSQPWCWESAFPSQRCQELIFT